MNTTTLGLLAGLALGLASVLDGFSGFAITAVLGAIGLIVGKVIDGELDLGNLVPDKNRQRR